MECGMEWNMEWNVEWTMEWSEGFHTLVPNTEICATGHVHYRRYKAWVHMLPAATAGSI